MCTSESEFTAYYFEVKVFKDHYTQIFPGSVIERWNKDFKPLGKGAAGAVWKIEEDGGAKRIRALKIIEKGTELSERELHGLVILNQYERHFTRFFGWWKHESELYLVTEFMEGGTLQDLIDCNHGDDFLGEDRAKTIAKKLLEATAIMHSRHIIHRDLKPTNILLADKATLDVRIADFGTSKSLISKAASTLTGTLGYMAPELYGSKDYDLKADIWSLGCVIHATLTGRSPYPNNIGLPKPMEYNAEWPDAALHLSKANQTAINFIKRLVAVNPEDRPTAKEALDDEWFL